MIAVECCERAMFYILWNRIASPTSKLTFEVILVHYCTIVATISVTVVMLACRRKTIECPDSKVYKVCTTRMHHCPIFTVHHARGKESITIPARSTCNNNIITYIFSGSTLVGSQCYKPEQHLCSK